MLDLNGIFHTAAQKVYEYGNHKKTNKVTSHPKKKRNRSANKRTNGIQRSYKRD